MRTTIVAGLCALLSACPQSPEEKLIRQEYRQGNETYVLGELPEYGLTGKCNDLVEYRVDGMEGIVILKEDLQHKLVFEVVNQRNNISVVIPVDAFAGRTAEEMFSYAKQRCAEVLQLYHSYENWRIENLEEEQSKKFEQEKTEIDHLLNFVLKGVGKKKERTWDNNPYF